eukprot:g688.t1
MAISSDEVNFLVYRYLQESGFVHSAFTFAFESVLAKSSVAGADVPPGALIAFLQKGLQYVDIEAHCNEDGSERPVTEQIGLLTPHVCEMLSGFDDPRVRDRDAPGAKRHKSGAGDNDDASPSKPSSSGRVVKGGKSGKSGKVSAFAAEDVMVLSAHTQEVFTIAWNPQGSTGVLASGAGDASARLWPVPTEACSAKLATSVSSESSLLAHGDGLATTEAGESPDVTTLDWNRDGTLLATGSYDHQVRVWNRAGQLQRTLSEHRGAIFSLKWSPSSRHLLSASLDETVIAWDATTGKVQRQFAHHTKPVLDVDWQSGSDSVFASCSTDMAIHICDIGQNRPLRSFKGGSTAKTGHRHEVNAIKWDPSGQLLASCSDDATAKLWRTDRASCVHSFEEHSKEVYTIQWSPCGQGSANPGADLVLASASFDSDIRLWDPNTGRCVQRLAKHSDSVYSVAFSPDGAYLASGDTNGIVYVWSAKDGRVLRKYEGGGDIYDVKWSPAGDRLAVCSSDKTIAVMDFRM